jgi:hypothetical protein
MNMGLLIAVSIGTVVVLYGVIIVRCLKQPEW